MSGTRPTQVRTLISKGEALVAATEYVGFRVVLAGTGDWSATFKGGGTVTFSVSAGETFDWHVTNVTVGTSGTAIGFTDILSA